MIAEHFITLLFGFFTFTVSGQHQITEPDSTITSINEALERQHDVYRENLAGSHIYAEENKIDNPVLLPAFQYEYKLAELDAKTPIKLDFNTQVKHYIDLYLTARWKELPSIIGLSTYYFPVFEEILDRFNLPLELKYLAFVESAFKPLAVSSSGAVGLWQFKLNSGKMFGLHIDSYIDERRDPEKSTEAASKYLRYLYNTFSDWQLAIAAYNGGPGEVRNAIQRSGGKTNFWELEPYLADQTKNYLPAFIAAVYLFNNYAAHGIYPKKPPFLALETETLQVKQQVSFEQISEVLDISLDSLEWLNPKYRTKEIPESTDGHELTLPTALVPAFIASENQIYGKPVKRDNYHSMKEKGQQVDGKKLIYHVVEKGEFYHLIAIKYNCTIENIKAWNQLESNFLYPGQKLKIWIHPAD